MLQAVPNHPAESGGVAGAVALVVAYALGVTDPGLIVAIGVVVGAIPAAITFLVSLGAKRFPKPLLGVTGAIASSAALTSPALEPVLKRIEAHLIDLVDHAREEKTAALDAVATEAAKPAARRAARRAAPPAAATPPAEKDAVNVAVAGVPPAAAN